MDFFEPVFQAATAQAGDPERVAAALVTAVLGLVVYGIASITPRAWGVAKLAARVSACAALRLAGRRKPSEPSEPGLLDMIAENLADPDAMLDEVADGLSSGPWVRRCLVAGAVAVELSDSDFPLRVLVDGIEGDITDALAAGERSRLFDLVRAAVKRVNSRDAAAVRERAKAALAKAKPAPATPDKIGA